MSSQPPRTLFMGTGSIALPAFSALLDDPSVEVIGLVCQPDKPVGRKQVLTPPPLKLLALERGIPCYQPERLRLEPHLIPGLQPELIVVMAYGQIIPTAVLALPRLGCWNLHASLLPRHRGAAPVQAAILAGDEESGITVMAVEPGLDTGPMLCKEILPLAPAETGESLHDRLAELAPVALRRALPLILAGSPPLEAQDPAAATHLGKLDRQDGVLDWSQSAETLDRKIRAFHPWPGTTTRLPDGTILKIFPPATVLPGRPADAVPGTLLQSGAAGWVVAAGEGSLVIHSIQFPGSRRMTVQEHLAGHVRQTGEIWGQSPPPAHS